MGRWDQHYDQLSPGRFSGEVTDLWLDRLQVFREVTNQIVEQRGSAWPGARFFGVVMDSEGEGMFCGRPLGAGGAAAFASGNAFTMRTPPRLDVIGVALSRETLQAHADATGDALLLQCGSEEDGLW
ncbi:MAG: hypothetical protein KIT73_11220, partial [Burkholderiales bacterium]|nr:hypothetical protein [Burkholderiales bacterium]